MPVDFGLRIEAGACFGPLIDPVLPPRCGPLAEAANLQDDVSRDSANGELTLQEIIVLADNLYLIARISDSRIVLDIEEVGAAQMCVPIRLARPDRLGIY